MVKNQLIFLERGLATDKIRDRMNWFLASRVGPDGKIPIGLIARASAHRRRAERELHRLYSSRIRTEEAPLLPPVTGSVNWTPIGPSVVAHGFATGIPRWSGRINGIAVGPGGNRIYIGAANGGVWRSMDGGETWTPIDPFFSIPSPPSPPPVVGLEFDSLSVGALAVYFDPSDPNNPDADMIFVGTGAYGVPGGVPGGGGGGSYLSVGIKSYNKRQGSPEATNLAGTVIYKIVIDPDDPTKAYAATSNGLYQRPTASPYDTWKFIVPLGPLPFSDLIVTGRGLNKVYYAVYYGNLNPPTPSQVVSTTDWKNWTVRGNAGSGRVSLAAGESDPSIIYAFQEQGILYRLDSGLRFHAGDILIPMNDGNVLEWDSTDGKWQLWNYNPSNHDDIFPEPPVAQGQWQTITAGHTLIPMNDGNVLDWVAADGTWWLWKYIPNGTDNNGNPNCLPVLVAQGKFKTIIAGHTLIPMNDGNVLDWVAANGTWRLWKYDPNGTNSKGNPDCLPELYKRVDGNVAQGVFNTIITGHTLIRMSDGRVLDWATNGNWRLYNYDPNYFDINKNMPDCLPSPPIAKGQWPTINADHTLIPMNDGNVLDWVAVDRATKDGTWQLWNYDFSKYDPINNPNIFSVSSIAQSKLGTFQIVNDIPPPEYLVSIIGWFALVVAVDPSDANTVYLAASGVSGDLAFYRGTISGTPGNYNFHFANKTNPKDDPTFIGKGVHADAHSFAFATNPDGSHDGTNVWIGTDGGLFQSTKSGSVGSFVAKNTGLAITQTTYIAQRPDTDAVLFAGSQDQGILRCWGEQAWFLGPISDAGGVAIDPNNQYQVMYQSIYTRLNTSIDGGISWKSLLFEGLFLPIGSTPTLDQAKNATIENYRTSFYSPIAVSPSGVNPTLVAFGTNRLWLTKDWGVTWVTLDRNSNPYYNGGTDLTQDVLDDKFPTEDPTVNGYDKNKLSPITAIAIASGTLIFAATGNQVWRFVFSGGKWSKTPITTTGFPPHYFITDIAVEDANSGSFYVSLGYSWLGTSNVYNSHVYYFDGNNWQSAVNAFPPPDPDIPPDVPAHAIVVDPDDINTIYLGTDVGCWWGTKTGTGSWSWALFSWGLPESAIQDLAIHEKTRLLRASTFGRGVWEIPLDATSGIDPDIYLRVDYADTGRLPGGARFPWVDGAPDPTTPPDLNQNIYLVYHWMSPDIKVRRGSLTGLPQLGIPPDYVDFAFNIGDQIDSATRLETADLGSNSIFVQVHNRGVAAPTGQVRVLLLLCDASAGLPPLPNDYATHINNGDIADPNDPNKTTWLEYTPGVKRWYFADPANPYRLLAMPDVRMPQIAEYDIINITAIVPPYQPGDNRFCAAAFITSTSDLLTATNTNLDQLVMQDKHVAFRTLLLLPPGVTSKLPGKLLSKTPPLFADAYRIVSSKGIFPNIGDAVNNFGDAIPLTKGFAQSPLTDGGKNVLELMYINSADGINRSQEDGYKLLKTTESFDLSINTKWYLINEDYLKVYVEYTAETQNSDGKTTTTRPGSLNYDVNSFASSLEDRWKSRMNNLAMVVDLGPFARLMLIKGIFDAKKGVEASYTGDQTDPDFPAPQLEFSQDLQPVINILQILQDLQGEEYSDAVKNGLKIAMSNSTDSWEYKFEASKEIPVVRFPPGIEYNDPNAPFKLEASLKVGIYFNAALSTASFGDPKKLLPTAGTFLDFYGRISVMCVSLSVATVYAVGQVNLTIAADTKVGPSLDMKFGFGAQVVVGLPVVGDVSVLYVVGVEIYADSTKLNVSAFMQYQGQAELLGGAVGVTISIEAKGTVSRANDRTDCVAQVTFGLDISIFLVIDIDFSQSWEEHRQIA